MNRNNEPRVLIIEDHDVLRVMLFTLLRHQPLSVDTATSTAEALLKVAACDYALIVIDLDMPHREGERFLKAFREQRPDSTTFVLAVRDPNGDSGLDPAIVSAVLNKPIELDTLADVVRETAAVVPPPEDPLPCPPAESDVRARLNGDAGLATN
jgi:CheY-like chemotaxis protein